MPICDDRAVIMLGSMKSLGSATFIDTGGSNGIIVKFVTHHCAELSDRVADSRFAKSCKIRIGLSTMTTVLTTNDELVVAGQAGLAKEHPNLGIKSMGIRSTLSSLAQTLFFLALLHYFPPSSAPHSVASLGPCPVDLM